jgi:AmmeMemoRadiSam system protein B/AmmeMemoRadiSam system protein A
MTKRSFIHIILVIVFLFSCNGTVKEPSVAGMFYPADKEQLNDLISRFLSKAGKSSNQGRLIALISPHAGYVYSGQVAAFGYKEIKGKDIKNIILIGPSHRAAFRGASVYTQGGFKTPLGTVKINEKIAKALLNEDADVRFYPEAYEKEHSLEVQLPFLQTVLTDFTIVPILIGSPTRKTFEHLITELSEILLDEKTLLLTSTDLSHFHDYSTAKEMDSKVIEAIERLSALQTEKLLRTGEGELCGGYPVLITLEAAKRAGANMGVLYDYANSGDVTGDRERVVGYASMGLYKNLLTDKEKEELLQLARHAIAEHVTKGYVPDKEVKNPKFRTEGAVFVTIKKGDTLRGCIGHIQPIMPLYQSIVNNAVAACSSDPRFPPVKEDELKNIDIEISILSPLKPLKEIETVQVGKHGLFIVKGMRSGLLLPQVATELGWNRETFLERLCSKAGLPKDAWKAAELYTFTAEVIK